MGCARSRSPKVCAFSAAPFGSTDARLDSATASRSSYSLFVSCDDLGNMRTPAVSFFFPAMSRLHACIGSSPGICGAKSCSGALRCASSRRRKTSASSFGCRGTISRWHAFCASFRRSTSISFSSCVAASGLPPGFPGRGRRQYDPWFSSSSRSRIEKIFESGRPCTPREITSSASGQSSPQFHLMFWPSIADALRCAL